MQVVEHVTKFLAPISEREHLEVVDITFKRECSGMTLRVLLDKEGGMSIDEYSRINNELSEVLDKESIISSPYTLEVSSPGLDRPLKTDRDFQRAIGKEVKVTTYAPLVDRKNVIIGKLLGIGKNTLVVLDKEGISAEIPKELIAKAKLEITFK